LLLARISGLFLVYQAANEVEVFFLGNIWPNVCQILEIVNIKIVEIYQTFAQRLVNVDKIWPTFCCEYSQNLHYKSVLSDS